MLNSENLGSNFTVPLLNKKAYIAAKHLKLSRCSYLGPDIIIRIVLLGNRRVLYGSFFLLQTPLLKGEGRNLIQVIYTPLFF